MKSLVFLLLFVVLFSAVVAAQNNILDHHVHIMSPRMIKLFRDVNIPFSKPDADYSDWQSIANRLGTKNVKLISMAYLYGHPEFGKVESEYELVKAENDYLLEAKKKSPKSIKAFCGINPLKDYALEEAERCRRLLRADGIKLHFNASQVYLTVPEHVRKVFPIFEYAAQHKLPVVLHFDNSHRKFGERDVKLLVDEILAKIKPVRLQIAHFGTSGGFNERTRGVIDAFLTQFETNRDMKRHKITFDISAVALDKDSEGVPKLTDERFAELAVYFRKLTPKRVVFGTDYPLYSVDEYLDILRKRVKLTEKEISYLSD